MENRYKKHFYTFYNGNTHYHGFVDITFDGTINWYNDAPIEDYGNWLLLDEYVEPDKAFEMFLNQLTD